MTSPIDEWVHIGTAARILGVAKETIRRWEWAGHIIPTRDDRNHRLFRKRDLQVMYHRCFGRRSA
jgi:excisionase family DNA binding protein